MLLSISTALLRRPLLLIAALGFLAGCQRAGYSYRPPAAAAQAAAPAASKLVFASFRLSTRPDSSTAIELLQVQVVPGVLKAPPPSSPPGPDYVAVAQLDAAGRVLGTAIQDHPLRPEVEYTTANQQLARRRARLAEAEFFVRLALLPTTTALRVSDFRGSRAHSSADFPLTLKP